MKTRDLELEGKLFDLCLDIFAHSELDVEITLGGNGTNASEAKNVAYEILSMLGLPRQGGEDFQRLVGIRKTQLVEDYGMEE